MYPLWKWAAEVAQLDKASVKIRLTHRWCLLVVGFLKKKCTYSLFILLKQFGEIEDCQIDENNLTAVITYKSRAEAEQVSSL